MERIALWAIVLILIVVVVFAQRRSGFTPSQGAPISLMDLEEYSGLSDQQKRNYRTELSTNINNLTTVASSTNNPQMKFMSYTNMLTGIMSNAFTTTTTSPQAPAMPQAPQAPAMPQAPQAPAMPM